MQITNRLLVQLLPEAQVQVQVPVCCVSTGVLAIVTTNYTNELKLQKGNTKSENVKTVPKIVTAAAAAAGGYVIWRALY